MKVVFMGTPSAAVPSIERLLSDGHDVVAVYAQPDRPSGRGNKITFSPVKEFAVSHGMEVHQPLKVKTPEALAEFQSHAADVAVVVAYGRILPSGFLSAFPSGAINVHFSLLPKYRGAAPVNWAIVNGETETGVTTMQMDEGLDTGNIYLQEKTLIGADENSIELIDRLAAMGADLLSATLRDLVNLNPRKQNDTEATLAPIMKKEDGLIDWTMTSTAIANRVRGFQPFPTAHTVYKEKKVTLWKAEAVSDAAPGLNAPGKIIEANGDILTVGCGDGSAIAVHYLQIEGKRRLPVRDFLNGIKLQPGEILG